MLPVKIKIQSDLVFVRFQVPVMTLLATTLTCVLMSTLLSNVLDAVHTLCLIEVSSKRNYWKLSGVLQTRTIVRTPTHTLKTPTCISWRHQWFFCTCLLSELLGAVDLRHELNVQDLHTHCVDVAFHGRLCCYDPVAGYSLNNHGAPL
jgi:hypothetical protein